MIGFTRLTGAIAAVLTVVAVAEAGYIVGQAKKAGRLESELAHVRMELGACIGTQTALERAHTACMDEIRVAKEENAHARSTIEQLTESIRKGSADVRREREVIYRLPGCAELRTLDLAAACPDLARSLRARAAEVSAAAND